MQPDENALRGVSTPLPARGSVASNGVNRCIKCGASDVRFDGTWLVCSYCKHRWNTSVIADELHLSQGIENLVGTSVLTGAKDIDTSSLVTVECSGCGASVTLNTETTLSSTCHWCRHTLSLNKPVNNGAVPDAILPFVVTREDAMNLMAAYVVDLLPKASPGFRSDFAGIPIRAVYLPYLVVDSNVTVRLDGEAWIERGMSQESPYPQDCIYLTEAFAVTREVDLSIDDLAIEARSTRTKLFAAVSTANVINAIQPFDVENAVRFDAHYIAEGVVFEKRDMDVAAAMDVAGDHCATIARNHVNPTLSRYSGGIRWDAEDVTLVGSRWVSMLLPVWLYAFEEQTPDGPMMHYIAVNGRTGKTEGSVPGDVVRADRHAATWRRTTIAVVAAPLALVAFGACIAALAGQIDLGQLAMFAGVPLVFIAWVIAFGRDTGELHRGDSLGGLRNPTARLMPERETKYEASHIWSDDRSLGDFTHLGGPEILDRNDYEPQRRAPVFEIRADDRQDSPPVNIGVCSAGASGHGRKPLFNGHGQRVDGQTVSAPPLMGDGVQFLPD